MGPSDIMVPTGNISVITCSSFPYLPGVVNICNARVANSLQVFSEFAGVFFNLQVFSEYACFGRCVARVVNSMQVFSEFAGVF